VREGFEPADYREYLKEKEKQDDDITSEMADPESPTSNDYAFAYEKMIMFDKVFDELLRESQVSATMEADKDTVGRGELRNRLIATGMFDLKDASSIIDIMLRIKRIKQVKWDTYRRANSSSNSKEDASA
jgi:hypothetical protein